MTTRDRLIENTQELLWERGYIGTSPRAILERSGAGQGSMYHHFAGKADLALAAVQRRAAAGGSRGPLRRAGYGDRAGLALGCTESVRCCGAARSGA